MIGLLELMKFIFSSFWVFMGTALLLAILLEGLASIVKSFRQKN